MMDKAAQKGVNLLLPQDYLAAREFSPDAAPIPLPDCNFPGDLMGNGRRAADDRGLYGGGPFGGHCGLERPVGVFEFPAFCGRDPGNRGGDGGEKQRRNRDRRRGLRRRGGQVRAGG
jgi:hypothetical protein